MKKVVQSYWPKKVSKVPIWKQKNDDSKIGKETEEERKTRMRKMVRENNRMARELGYARGVKQMKEEGVL